MDASARRNLRITIINASGLHNSHRFSLPDPFAIATIDDREIHRTTHIEKSLVPSWNETFDTIANPNSILAIRIFDRKKSQKTEQGLLGFLKIQIGSVIDLTTNGTKAISNDLKISKNGGLVSYGKLNIMLFTILPPAAAPSKQRPILSPPPAVNPRKSLAPIQKSNDQIYTTHGKRSDTSLAPSIDRQRQIGTSEDAVLAWNRRFATSQVRLNRDDPPPFKTIQALGCGGMGIVGETQLDGIPLALKRSYTRELTDKHLNEVKILSRITKRRHRHIVELVGSYVHKQRDEYELGLLLWPVAHSDLAMFLEDVDSLQQWIERKKGHYSSTGRTDLDSFLIENLSGVTGGGSSRTHANDPIRLHGLALGVLRSRFCCIANAVNWLHQQGIRHKDLKPSQILLSQDGLWITDFGLSKDISDTSGSQTNGGRDMTLKYHSPEREQRKPCGRPEDVFALGCIFLEMFFQLAKPVLRSSQWSPPWQQKGWYFQAHLKEVNDILNSLERALHESRQASILPKLIAKMLALKPEDRPNIAQVVNSLASSNYSSGCCK